MISSRQTSSTPAPSENLRRFVASGDLANARAALRTGLNDNRADRTTLMAALTYAQERIDGLCEPYAVKAFANAIDPDVSHWSEAYYDDQLAFLKTNFAAERYTHMVDVRLHLRERGVPGFVARDADESPAPHKPVASQKAPLSSRLLLVVIVLCGGVAVIVIMLKLFGYTP
jgi:hypothetical protein